MTLLESWARGGLLLMAVWALGGCVPSDQSQLEEEKEPHYMAGKSRVSTLDYRGAIEAFEKALQANPHSSQAHFELAWLFDQKEPDPAAAIYHYEQYLRLRPNAENAEVVKQHIMACKQELAKTVSLGPVTEKVQHELEQMIENRNRLVLTNSMLMEQNRQLIEELNKWRAYGAAGSGPTNRVVARANPTYGTTSGGGRVDPGTAYGGSGSASGGRSHIVKAGETPTSIARQYGVKTEALIAANPGLNPRRMKVGQSLAIPGH